MGKKQEIEMDGLLNKTEEPAAVPDIVNPKGVGLLKSEWEEIDRIAGELNVTGHAVAKYLLRYGLKEYQKGNVKFNVVKQPKLEFPE